METYTASDFKNSFGKALMKSQHEPVRIEKHGEVVSYLVSASVYEEYEAQKHAILKAKIEKGMEDVKAGNLIDGDTVMTELRQVIDNA